MDDLSSFAKYESNVRSYCRLWPALFQQAEGSYLRDVSGRSYLDFFAGAGALNYGHNDPRMKDALISYLSGNHLVHSLDMYTPAKRDFLDSLHSRILEPRGLDYRAQFPGPAGAMAVEAAIKLARKYTGRTGIACFANAFHGMTSTILDIAGRAAYPPGSDGSGRIILPYGAEGTPAANETSALEQLLDGTHDKPAAVLVEAVQGEGGMHAADLAWLGRIGALCREHEVLLIVDEVQMGCGRTGTFFSFEQAGIQPDIVCLSKSLSGYGLPLALTLLRPELDIWEPGEHTGTFRGPDPAFVTAVVAMDFWAGSQFQASIARKAAALRDGVAKIASAYPDRITGVRGRGLALGFEVRPAETARTICVAAFERGLLLETSGFSGEVVKLMPPLTAADDELRNGIETLRDAVSSVLD